MYRKLYEKVITVDPESVDFDMNASKYKNDVNSWLSICFSVTLRMFHGVIFGVIVLVMIIIVAKGSV